jgi:membrane protein required for colicin V production
MNYIDMFIMVLLIYAVVRGMVRGLVLQLASLASLIVGIYIALRFSGFTTHFLSSRWAMDYEYLYLVSLALTFSIVFILIHLLGKWIDTLVETAHLSFINKLAGALFNVLKVVVIAGVILVLIDRIDNRVKILPKNAREGSFFYKPVTGLVRLIFPRLDDHRQSSGSGEFVVWNQDKF